MSGVSYFLQNVKEHAPSPAGASVDSSGMPEPSPMPENRAAGGGCCVSSCSESSFDLAAAEEVMRNVMQGLADLVKPRLTEEFLSVDLEVIRDHLHELFECSLGECLTIWSEEKVSENSHLVGGKRAIPLLVLAWRCLYGLEQPLKRVDEINGDASCEHGCSEKVDLPEVVRFWDHLFSSPNDDVVAPARSSSDFKRDVVAGCHSRLVGFFDF
jgi:hypothetical protein